MYAVQVAQEPRAGVERVGVSAASPWSTRSWPSATLTSSPSCSAGGPARSAAPASERHGLGARHGRVRPQGVVGLGREQALVHQQGEGLPLAVAVEPLRRPRPAAGSPGRPAPAGARHARSSTADATRWCASVARRASAPPAGLTHPARCSADLQPVRPAPQLGIRGDAAQAGRLRLAGVDHAQRLEQRQVADQRGTGGQLARQRCRGPDRLPARRARARRRPRAGRGRRRRRSPPPSSV